MSNLIRKLRRLRAGDSLNGFPQMPMGKSRRTMSKGSTSRRVISAMDNPDSLNRVMRTENAWGAVSVWGLLMRYIREMRLLLASYLLRWTLDLIPREGVRGDLGLIMELRDAGAEMARVHVIM